MILFYEKNISFQYQVIPSPLFLSIIISDDRYSEVSKMDQFLSECQYEILYQWLKHHLPNGFIDSKNEWAHSLTTSYKQYHIEISFYDNGVIEETINDTSNGDVVYYIHFLFLNFNQSVKILKDFLIYLKSLMSQKKNILICCSCGLTSSLFAEKLEENFKKQHMNVHIEACDIHTLANKSSNYELVLLTPQVHYYKPQLLQLIDKPIITIPTTDYACHNYNHIISIIDSYLLKEDI